MPLQADRDRCPRNRLAKKEYESYNESETHFSCFAFLITETFCVLSFSERFADGNPDHLFNGIWMWKYIEKGGKTNGRTIK